MKKTDWICGDLNLGSWSGCQLCCPCATVTVTYVNYVYNQQYNLFVEKITNVSSTV